LGAGAAEDAELPRAAREKVIIPLANTRVQRFDTVVLHLGRGARAIAATRIVDAQPLRRR
jgi:hypothetical protein